MQSLPASNVKLWRWRALREGCQTTRKPSHTSKNMLQNDVFCQIHRFLKSIKKTLKNSSPFHRPQLFFFFFLQAIWAVTTHQKKPTHTTKQTSHNDEKWTFPSCSKRPSTDRDRPEVLAGTPGSRCSNRTWGQAPPQPALGTVGPPQE